MDEDLLLGLSRSSLCCIGSWLHIGDLGWGVSWNPRPSSFGCSPHFALTALRKSSRWHQKIRVGWIKINPEEGGRGVGFYVLVFQLGLLFKSLNKKNFANEMRGTTTPSSSNFGQSSLTKYLSGKSQGMKWSHRDIQDSVTIIDLSGDVHMGLSLNASSPWLY